MTDKKRQYTQTYLNRKLKGGYVLKQLFIHKSILDDIKDIIKRWHRDVEIHALLGEIRQETPPPNTEKQPA